MTSFVDLSVIVPALNEEAFIGPVLDRIATGSGIEGAEIIVADGGSTDRTIVIAQQYARVVHSKRGRGVQMNNGSKEATGSILLFCHADTLLPMGYAHAIHRALKAPEVVGGAFSPLYVPSSPLLRRAEKILRRPAPAFMFGDQAIFARRWAFESVGRYEDTPLMEDVALVHSMRRLGRMSRVPDHVMTSARRFHERGVARQLWLDIRLWTAYKLGWPLGRLALAYHVTRRDRPELVRKT